MRTNIWTVISVGMLASGIAACSSSSDSGVVGGNSGSSSVGGSSATSAGGSSAGGESSKPVGGSSGGEGGSSTSAGSSGTPLGGSSGGRAGGIAGNSMGGSTSKPGGAGGNSNTGGGGGGKAGNAGGTTSNPGGSVAGNAGGQASTGTRTQAGNTAGSTGTGSTEAEVVTSAEKDYWNTSGKVTKVTSGTADVTIDLNAKGQRWDGFGGTFNEMGWDAMTVLPETDVANAMKLLFDAKDGANFIYGRIPMGASDYASSWYTLDDLPSGTTTDYNMEKFSIARDKQKLIPFIKEAKKVRSDIRFWASPWVVPAWMKNGSKMKNDAQTLGAHALYMVKFAEEYAKEGIKIEAIHPQNEPGYGQVSWDQKDLIAFMKTYLGPLLAERLPDTEVWCGTMSKADGGGYDMAIALATANDPEAMKYVKGFGLQWNVHDAVTTLQAKGVPVMQTEHRCGNYNFGAPYWDESRYSTTKAQNDHLYGEESWQGIRDWIVAGVNSYCAWNMVLDTNGKSLGNWPQNALLVVDKTAKKLITTPAYYTFKHFSYYIAVGATRVGTSASGDAYKGAGTSKYGSDKVAYDLVNAFAFKNPDGSVIVQLYNKASAAKKTTVDLDGGLYQIDVPAHGWATLRIPQ